MARDVDELKDKLNHFIGHFRRSRDKASRSFKYRD